MTSTTGTATTSSAPPKPAHGVVITGAAQGLGKAIARRFAADGWSVVGVDVAADKLEAAMADLGPGHRAVVGDAGDPAVIDEACLHAVELGGGLASAVLNAGVVSPGPSASFALDEWDRVLSVNLRGAFVGAQVAHRHLVRNGSLVMISSVTGTRGLSARAAYCASKAGVEGLVRSLSNEWSGGGIRVNAVAPGTFATDMQQAMVSSGRISLDHYLARIPMNRVGRVEELADAVEYLASPRASYITGIVLPVDGGWSGSGMSTDAH
jgi:NAD(P)-dependent dehydrogenase (short-subunit alcohol dehydrogenase family)